MTSTYPPDRDPWKVRRIRISNWHGSQSPRRSQGQAKHKRVVAVPLGAVHATPTRVESTVPTLPDEPERAAVADVAPPLD